MSTFRNYSCLGSGQTKNKLQTKEDEELGKPLTDIQPSPLIIGAATVPSYSPFPTTSEISSAPPVYPSLEETHAHTWIIRVKDGPWIWNEGCNVRPQETLNK